jgi:hypothetical protein
MGLSSKPPGESIGNKGLGFRSVLHIGGLTVSVVPDVDSRSFSLFREERRITGKPGTTIVDLKASGSFLVARTPIAETAMKEAIAHGVEQKQLHSHWLDWEGEPRLAT